MEEVSKDQLDQIMVALERLQSLIDTLKIERDSLIQAFKDQLPTDIIMKLVK